MRHTDFTDPSTIDVDEVIANIDHDHRVRGHHWTDRLSWPNVTAKALADEITRLRDGIRDLECVRVWCGLDALCENCSIRDQLLGDDTEGTDG